MASARASRTISSVIPPSGAAASNVAGVARPGDAVPPPSPPAAAAVAPAAAVDVDAGGGGDGVGDAPNADAAPDPAADPAPEPIEPASPWPIVGPAVPGAPPAAAPALAARVKPRRLRLARRPISAIRSVILGFDVEVDDDVDADDASRASADGAAGAGSVGSGAATACSEAGILLDPAMSSTELTDAAGVRCAASTPPSAAVASSAMMDAFLRAEIEGDLCDATSPTHVAPTVRSAVQCCVERCRSPTLTSPPSSPTRDSTATTALSPTHVRAFFQVANFSAPRANLTLTGQLITQVFATVRKHALRGWRGFGRARPRWRRCHALPRQLHALRRCALFKTPFPARKSERNPPRSASSP